MSARSVLPLALLLCLVAGGIFYVKAVQLNLPLQPDAESAVWTVESRASFIGQGKVKARLVLPSKPQGFRILDESFVLRDFGVAEAQEAGQRVALFSARRANGPQALYYRLVVQPDEQAESADMRFPGYPPVPDYPEMYQVAINGLLDHARTHSADIGSFARQLILRLNTERDDPTVRLLREEATTPAAKARQLVDILAGARIPARVVHGLTLVHGAREARLQPWLQVHNEQRWLAFNPETGEEGWPPQFLLWHTSALPEWTIENGSQAELRFSVRRVQSRTLDVLRDQPHPLAQLSLLGLPLDVQNVYTILLMVPFGALLVVLLRNIVGVRTFGTFMPVLIALAFRETDLLWGCVLFSVVVAVGLALRFWLERLKLLLVPRLAAVLILVIILMLLVSLASHRLGFERGLSVALFPMVILAMTIERMSIVWEEHGARDAVTQGLGSLAVAVVAYLVMSQPALQHIVSVFPEVLLVLLALTLILGRYTGYRLTEYWRFRSVLKGKTA